MLEGMKKRSAKQPKKRKAKIRRKPQLDANQLATRLVGFTISQSEAPANP
jgi:hypothetical protein